MSEVVLPALSAFPFLDAFLEPLAHHLARPDVTDIFINGPGTLWTETLGGSVESHQEPRITDDLLWRLAHQIASLAHQGINREHPLLSARLPDGSRIQIVAPPATRSGIALAIRKHVMSNLSLGDYVTQGAFASTNQPSEDDIAMAHSASDLPMQLAVAVRARKNIVISGGTSTGKTTFLNALIREIPADERLIYIEDTPELLLNHANAVGLIAVKGELGETRIGTDDLLQASLRMRPDRIILGELRGPEAYTFLRAVNTGHPGSMTTVHANSPDGAIEQLALIILQSGSQLRREDIVHYIRSTIDLIVQLGRSYGKRRIDAIVTAAGEPLG
jgi:type IV secretion system protein VirB11